MIEMQRVGEQTDVLGEGPVWDVQEQALYWVDIRSPAVRRYGGRDRKVTSWAMPEMVGSLAVRDQGGLLVALKSALAYFDPQSGSIRRVASPEADRPGQRFNDGKCDRQGRFWAGTMNDVTRAPEGTLYRFDGAACVPFESGITIPNSLCWSRDARTMYFADSPKRILFAYDYDPDRGEPGNKRVFTTIAEPGIPDGSTVDAEDCLWCAEYGGWKVTRFAPDGRRLRSIELPVQQPTSCMFGGPDLDVLYVTTASQRLNAGERAQQLLAGALLAMDVGVRGLPEARFAG
jgi:sugar lactone lactonase YvrE